MLLREKKNYTLVAEAEMPRLMQKMHKVLKSQRSDLIAIQIFNILMALWTVKWPPSVGKCLVDPTICHLALSMLESERSFKHPKHVTGLIAKKEYCLRLVFALKI